MQNDVLSTLYIISMTTAQIVEAARKKLPYTSEFEHEVIRIPVRNTNLETNLLQPDVPTAYKKPFYEVEFKKQYISKIAIGWEFVKIY